MKKKMWILALILGLVFGAMWGGEVRGLGGLSEKEKNEIKNEIDGIKEYKKKYEKCIDYEKKWINHGVRDIDILDRYISDSGCSEIFEKYEKDTKGGDTAVIRRRYKIRMEIYKRWIRSEKREEACIEIKSKINRDIIDKDSISWAWKESGCEKIVGKNSTGGNGETKVENVPELNDNNSMNDLTEGENVGVGGGGGKKCNKKFLGLNPWHYGLKKDSDCNILSPVGTLDGDEGGKAMAKFIWTIVLNTTSSIMTVLGFVMIFALSYGGFLQITSRGDPGKVVAGKKVIMNAIIGLLIAVFATVIINTILGVLIK